jgi:hypothetical protein
MALHEFRPSLDGCLIEVCLALISEEYDPRAAAEHVCRCMNPVERHSFRLLADASFCFTKAADAKTSGDVNASAEFMRQGKALLRQVVIFWLKSRTCSCCVGLRNRLESEEEQECVAQSGERQQPAGDWQPVSNAVTGI